MNVSFDTMIILGFLEDVDRFVSEVKREWPYLPHEFYLSPYVKNEVLKKAPEVCKISAEETRDRLSGLKNALELKEIAPEPETDVYRAKALLSINKDIGDFHYADALILASLKRGGINVFYTQDRTFRLALIREGIQPRRLPV